MTTEQATQEPFEGWSQLSLMGHRNYLGYVSTIEVAGVQLLKIDTINQYDGTPGRVVRFHPNSIYEHEFVAEEEIRREIAERQEAIQRRRRLLEPPPRTEIVEETPPTVLAAVAQWIDALASGTEAEMDEARDGIAFAYATWHADQPQQQLTPESNDDGDWDDGQ